MVVIWGCAILFLILSLVLLSGRGGFLIAGYNTSDSIKKSQYDEKKLCRVTGVGMLFITVLLFAMAILEENMPDWFVGFFLIATMLDSLIMMIVANTKCYATNPDGSRVTVEQLNFTEEDIKRNKAVGKWSAIFTVVTFIIIGILITTGNIVFHCNEEELLIEASYYPDMTISYDEITSMEYREEYLKGARVGGFGSFRLTMGGFENKELGRYTRYTYNNCRAYVIVTLEGKKNPLVIAGIDSEKTKELYDELEKRAKGLK